MHLKIEPKKVVDAYSTPIVQQTSFWSKVKERLGMDSRAFDFSVRNSEIYTNVGGYAHTQGDFITFFHFRKRQREENIRRAALEIHTALLSAGAADFITPN